MADLYNTVQKQGKQLDGLQKKVDAHDTRIETLETKTMATPPQMPVNIPAPKVTVNIPDNIATKENVYGAVNQALKNQTDYMVDGITKLYTDILPKPSYVSQPLSPAISDEQIARIAQAAADKAADKAVSKRYEKLDAMADTVMHRIYNLVHGAIWAAIPKWAYIVFAIAVLAVVGFGYGFFYQFNENYRLKHVEWLYRYERMWWKGKEQEDLLRREKIFAVGTQQEQDSMKTCIRQYEKARHIEETFLYFNPSEK